MRLTFCGNLVDIWFALKTSNLSIHHLPEHIDQDITRRCESTLSQTMKGVWNEVDLVPMAFEDGKKKDFLRMILIYHSVSKLFDIIYTIDSERSTLVEDAVIVRSGNSHLF